MLHMYVSVLYACQLYSICNCYVIFNTNECILQRNLSPPSLRITTISDLCKQKFPVFFPYKKSNPGCKIAKIDSLLSQFKILNYLALTLWKSYVYPNGLLLGLRYPLEQHKRQGQLQHWKHRTVMCEHLLLEASEIVINRLPHTIKISPPPEVLKNQL